MKRSMILIIVPCLLIGMVSCGYGITYLIYEPKLASYEIQVSNLTSKASELGQTITSQEAQISTLQTNLSRAEAEATNYKEQVTALELQASSLQDRLDKVLDITVTQHYNWTYRWKTWQWDLPIPLSIYYEYLEKPRPPLTASYVNMAKDPNDDPYIDRMIQQINNAALEERFTEVQKLNFVIAFVQSLPYTVDIETTPYDEYPRYPLETLFDRGGDCEDTSILVAALLDRMGYDVALLHLKNAQHMAVGISIAGNYGSYYEYDGKKYFYLETTGEGWQIGQIPLSYTEARAYVYPLS